MKTISILIAILLIIAGAIPAMHIHSRPNANPVAHVQNGFEFTVRAPYEKVAPLFGAHAERAWGGEDWDPQFLHPQPARDIEGEVFTVAHGHTRGVWVNTAFNLESGHVQYVYVIPDVQAVLINIHLRHDGLSSTEVKVTYERTALTSRFNNRVREMGQKDASSANEWRSAIEKYLAVSNTKS
jgi:hypothetical protein